MIKCPICNGENKDKTVNCVYCDYPLIKEKSVAELYCDYPIIKEIYALELTNINGANNYDEVTDVSDTEHRINTIPIKIIVIVLIGIFLMGLTRSCRVVSDYTSSKIENEKKACISVVSKLEESLNKNEVDKVFELLYPDNYVGMTEDSAIVIRNALRYLMSDNYNGDKWGISDVKIDKCDGSEIEEAINDAFNCELKIEETYLVTVKLIIDDNVWNNYRFNVFKTSKDQWVVYDNFFNYTQQESSTINKTIENNSDWQDNNENNEVLAVSDTQKYAETELPKTEIVTTVKLETTTVITEVFAKTTSLGKGYVATKDDDLNLRKTMSTNSEVLATIPKNTIIELFSTNDPNWYCTYYKGIEGYVSADLVALGEPPVTEKRSSYLGKGYVDTTDDDLNLRKSPSTDSDVLTTIPKNTKLELYSADNSGWYYTSYNGKNGYVSADWVTFGDPPAVKPNTIYGLKPYLIGQISSGGLKIEGYTTDYVCYGGTQTVQWNCEDTWHITAKRRTSSYGVEWYECWDTDDGDYYGWIDSRFLSFYSSGSSNNQGNNENSVTNISPYKTGEISSNGKKIEGYTTDYVCNGGAKTAQWICEDTWHITARRKTSSYGVEWYECWDTDDGDYYGWIDGKFLRFYQ